MRILHQPTKCKIKPLTQIPPIHPYSNFSYSFIGPASYIGKRWNWLLGPKVVQIKRISFLGLKIWRWGYGVGRNHTFYHEYHHNHNRAIQSLDAKFQPPPPPSRSLNAKFWGLKNHKFVHLYHVKVQTTCFTYFPILCYVQSSNRTYEQMEKIAICSL